MFPHLIVDVEASALSEGYPIELAIADIENGCVHAWLIRPHALWAWDVWSAESEKIHGLSRAVVDSGEDVHVVAQALVRVAGDRRLASDNPEFDREWLRKLFEAAGEEDLPVRFAREFLGAELRDLGRRHKRSAEDIDALNRARNSAVDHSAAGDAAAWAAAIELAGAAEKIDLARIDAMLGKWIARAQAATPWRAATKVGG
ncbi:MAG: hypothetical protein ING19_02755 [Azospirillum sp.]|nr:hypothetical protein [Azospirillum sp.]